MRTSTRRQRPLWLLCACVALSACGGGDDQQAKKDPNNAQYQRVIAQNSQVRPSDFPSPKGKTLQQVADTVRSGPQVGLATSTYVPGTNRFAFGMLDSKNQFIYGKTAIYLASDPSKPAQGPFPARPEPLVVRPPFRSRGAAEESAPLAAIYAAQIRVPRPGDYEVLVMTKLKDGSFGAPTKIHVESKAKQPIPEVGERPPSIHTETVANPSGSKEVLDTRVPPDDMHGADLADVIGKKPVALLFATPALCQTRVCGPVTDIAEQLKAKYGRQVEFIHQEVYVDNNIKKGLRPPLRAFKLRSEPWLFTFDRRGRVADRLEGSFGTTEFEQAVKAALQR